MINELQDFLRWVIYSALGKTILLGLLALPVIVLIRHFATKQEKAKDSE